MPSDSRADELLQWAAEELQTALSKGGSECRQEIRAYLAEPQDEPEFVWRVTLSLDGGRMTPSHPMPEARARRVVSRLWKLSYVRDITIERAQIGPWEDVESS